METHRALIVITAALLPTYLLRFSLLGIPTNMLEFLVVVTLMTGLINPSVRRTWLTAWHVIPKSFVGISGVFLAAAAVSTIISPHLQTSLGILKSWVVIPMVFGWLVYAAAIADRAMIKNIIRALIASGVVVSLFGISQLGTLDRIKSVFDVPNSLALFLAPLIVLSVFLPREGVVAWSSSVTMIIALLATQSFAGVLSVLIVVGALCALKFRALGLVCALCFLLCAFLIFAPKVNYLLQPNSSAAVRLQLWSVSAQLIREHPILGVGLGTFEPAYQTKLHERFAAGEPALPEFVFRDPHNWLLSFWLNTGLLGLLSFVCLHGYAFGRIFLPLTKGESGAKRREGVVAAALATLLIFGLVDTIYWKNDLAALHWILLGLLVARSRQV